MGELVGIGSYTPAEASRLLRVPAGKITRWLRGHRVDGRDYEPLWRPQIDVGDGRLYLGFRDLMEVRVAAAFIANGIPSHRIRAAIDLAREEYGHRYPLSADKFRYQGRDIFLRVFERDENGKEREALINTFRQQYVIEDVLRPVLKGIEFDEVGEPRLWWPNGQRGLVVVDPQRAFGQPIDSETSVPTAILAGAAEANGPESAARLYDVPLRAVQRAMAFEASLGQAA